MSNTTIFHIDQPVDVLVYGSTPAGITSAIRAAREGKSVLLVSVGQHIGGMLTGGLSYTDTVVVKPRAPLLEEYFTRVRAHYAKTSGVDSADYVASENGYIAEPSVSERILEEMVAKESPRLRVVRGFRVEAAERKGRLITSALFVSSDGKGDTLRVAATVFIDCSYEGDLMAFAGASYRIGKESREEYAEQFAGYIHGRHDNSRLYPLEATGDVDRSSNPDSRGPLDIHPWQRKGELDILPHPCGFLEFDAFSTGAGDEAIQAYNYRVCLTNNPAKRVMVEKPADYDRSAYLGLLGRILDAEKQGLNPLPGPNSPWLCLRKLPGDKVDMNGADMPGKNWDYPEAGPERRDEIARMHRSHALGLIWFVQNDPEVPESFRSAAREWGLPNDEFTDNNHFPHELYVREARRLVGRHVFREQDARYAHGLHRTPIHEDAIAIAEYPMDSHATGSGGGFYASEITRPSQVPLRSLLPKEMDNLLVPVCISSTHVAFGSLRVEPCWMHIGEAAGYAAAEALDTATPPGRLDTAKLQVRLAENRMTLSFYNELNSEMSESWVPAVQYLGTRGFFPSFNARPLNDLTRSEAREWLALYAKLLAGRADVNAGARAIYAAEQENAPAIGAGEFIDGLRRHEAYWLGDSRTPSTAAVGEKITRARAAELIYAVLKQGVKASE